MIDIGRPIMISDGVNMAINAGKITVGLVKALDVDKKTPCIRAAPKFHL